MKKQMLRFGYKIGAYGNNDKSDSFLRFKYSIMKRGYFDLGSNTKI